MISCKDTDSFLAPGAMLHDALPQFAKTLWEFSSTTLFGVCI